MTSTLLAAAAALAAVTAPRAGNHPASRPFDRIVVFGDSLSDSGNAGRFSNGPVWVELLARYLRVDLSPAVSGGTNFAVGGAPVDGPPGSRSLREQAEDYLERFRSGSAAAADAAHTLYVVFGGANDVFAAMYDPAPAAAVERAGDMAAHIVADLIAAADARTFLTVNLPNIGAAPAVRAAGPAAVPAVRLLSAIFNEAFDIGLRAAEESAGMPVAIHRVDLFALSEQVFAEPQRFGFRNAAEPCLGSRGDPANFVFWDEIHPTTAAHARLAEAAIAALALPG